VPPRVPAFVLRGRFLIALVLRSDAASASGAFFEQLDKQRRKTPQLFFGAPLTLDVTRLNWAR
jgi:septum site-determining protein MinC